jgi:hypothetical protein
MCHQIISSLLPASRYIQLTTHRSQVKNALLVFRRFQQSCILLILLLAIAAPSLASETAQNSNWPYEISTPKGLIVIYQPQPEKLDGNTLHARSAVAIETDKSSEPVFGVVWFQATLDTDRDERTASIEDIKINRLNFPNQDIEKEKTFSDIVEKEMSTLNLQITMDSLLTTLEATEKQQVNTQKINTDPPRILFEKQPAVLISLDGEPNMKPVENSDLMRVINTPFTIIFKQKENAYYLFADANTWYKARDIKGQWEIAASVPKEVVKLAPESQNEDEGADGEEASKPGPEPKIIVVTEPTELISCTGDPEFTPISGTELLYVSNTDSDVLLHVTSQSYYILLAGRWFTSKSTDGPWDYVAVDKLPADFSKIPEESEMGTVLYAVPGTQVAKEAVMDAAIPQTATIDRKTATLKVEFDGDPKFEKISDTKITYAINTTTPVIHVKNEYYACDNAVWFVSTKATGPWKTATFVPGEIYTIPPECPIYHVTFVRIYKVTEDEIIMGYTAGYTHTYVYNTTIVYGSGYYYPGYCGYYCYPYHSTWGFHVRYNPWSGWGCGFSYSNGPFRFTIGFGGWYRGGWWGPGRHRGYRRGYRHGYRRGASAGYRAGYRKGSSDASRRNLYKSQGNKARVRSSSPAMKNKAVSAGKSNRPNNVFADKNGDIHRKTQQGWEKKTSDGWKTDIKKDQSGQKFDQKPTKKSVKKNQSRQQLDKSSFSRERGNQQSRKFKQTRSGGSRMGGGGRKR